MTVISRPVAWTARRPLSTVFKFLPRAEPCVWLSTPSRLTQMRVTFEAVRASRAAGVSSVALVIRVTVDRPVSWLAVLTGSNAGHPRDRALPRNPYYHRHAADTSRPRCPHRFERHPQEPP